MEEIHRIKDKSGDKKYFTQTPRIIWALSRTTYDKVFWDVVKDIAGESGECKITTEELAILCMMSIGKVSDCRNHWLSNEMLEGQREKEVGQQNSIWHLTIPDIWEENIDFSKTIPKIINRIEYKKNQRVELEKEKIIEDGAISPGEKAKDKAISPGEKGSSPSEKGSSPGEKATFIEEEPLKEPKEKPPNFSSDINPSKIFLTLPQAEKIANDCINPQRGYKGSKEIHRKLKIMIGAGMTEAELRADLEGKTIWQWLGKKEPTSQTFKSFPKQNSYRQENGNGKFYGKQQEETDLEKWVKEFMVDKFIPLDTELNDDEQRIFYNSREHPKVLKPAYEGKWPEDEILRRYEIYFERGGYYAKAGHPLALFISQFDNFSKRKKRRKEEKFEMIVKPTVEQRQEWERQRVESARRLDEQNEENIPLLSNTTDEENRSIFDIPSEIPEMLNDKSSIQE